jgi:hypothetical protein
LAYVLDMDALQADVEMDERYHERVERALELAACEEWEEFRLVDRGVGGFDVLLASLFALDAEHSGVLRVLLERCRDLSVVEMEERGGLVKALSRVEAAEEVARGARQERRAQRGYVTLADARSFFKLAVGGLQYETGRDPITHAYFRDVYGKRRAQADLAVAAGANKSPKRLIDTLSKDLTPHQRVSPAATLSAGLDVLRARDADGYERRVAELAYLANVLVTVSEPASRRLRPIEASETALRVCAEGIQALGLGQQTPAELGVTLEGVLLDVVFRAGWSQFAKAHGPVEPTRRVLLDLAAEILRSGGE